jgi:NADH:ubiquinone oxidoreductase subunit 4 (subunit M)
MKIVVMLICFIWQSIYLLYATRAFLQKRIKKEIATIYQPVSLRQQLMIIGVMAELLQAGIDPINAIKSGINILDENKST